MEKLVFDYTYCSFPEQWDWDIPFEYTSKEQFILDVIDDPMTLKKVGIPLDDFQLELGYIPEHAIDVDKYVFTLEEWFKKNK